MLLRAGPPDQSTPARQLFWPLLDLSLLLSALHAALVPLWPALRWGHVTPAARAFGVIHGATTIVFCIFAGMILINNLGRSSAEDETPITLRLAGREPPADARTLPNPTTGQAAAAIVIAMASMVATLLLN